ncbi:DinB family protein [Halalkalibacter sp. APA_J-10(15)]|uniref:DinB family protein n=1 Tax=Halalkalibacter sp. APA_J-10(15) TaxID=2933805 RepID=UPI001FF3C877|nr:DinB family protein [Halalkalibacter sp. APA_J-10(15)]MCK0472230.1 DinB family protein [Halalkalibacter sp. APA_J-10(15)]
MNKQLIQFQQTMDEVKGLKEKSTEFLLQPIAKGKWSTREVVAHMYYWDEYILKQMAPNIADGERLLAFPDHDEHNEKGLELVKDYTARQIIDLFLETREKLVRELERVDDHIRFMIGAGKRRFSIESFVTIFVRHDAHHLKQIQELEKK